MSRLRRAALVAVLAVGASAWPASASAGRLLGVVPDTAVLPQLIAPAAGAPAASTGGAPAASTTGAPFASTTGAPFASVARRGALTAAAGPVAHAADLVYGGGAVAHSNRTHLVFWSPAGSGLGFPPGYYVLIEQFLTDVAHDSHQPTNVYSLSGQYRDPGGAAAYDSTYGGASLDTDPLPRSGCHEPLLGGPGWTVCLTDAQLQAELTRFTAAQNLPRTGRDIYFLVTPDGFGSCGSAGPDNCALGGTTSGSYCGYHSVTTQDRLLYAVIPYNAVPGHCQSGNPRPNGSVADPVLSTISHEHNEVVTDPFGDAWIDPTGSEDGDLCIRAYGAGLGSTAEGTYNEAIGAGHYYLQAEWSNWTGACEARAPADTLSFAVSRRPTVGRPLAVTARGAAAYGRFSGYAWAFGAHGAGAGPSPRYTFRRAGRYRVRLRGTDSAGLWTFATRTVAVAPARRPLRRRRR